MNDMAWLIVHDSSVFIGVNDVGSSAFHWGMSISKIKGAVIVCIVFWLRWPHFLQDLWLRMCNGAWRFCSGAWRFYSGAWWSAECPTYISMVIFIHSALLRKLRCPIIAILLSLEIPCFCSFFTIVFCTLWLVNLFPVVFNFTSLAIFFIYLLIVFTPTGVTLYYTSLSLNFLRGVW